MTEHEALRIASIRKMLSSGRARLRREEARLSQSEVGEVLRVSPATVSRWESGEREPGARHALAYASLLDLLDDEQVPA